MEVTLRGQFIRIVLTGESYRHLGKLRQLPFRRFEATENAWYVDHVAENWDCALAIGLPLEGVPAPTAKAEGIRAHRSSLSLCVQPTPAKLEMCRGIPEHKSWSKTTNTWLVKPTRRNVEYLMRAFPSLAWSDEAKELVASAESPFVQSKAELERLIDRATQDYKFGTTPFQHQLAAFALGRDARSFAYFMEQGTGKTKVTIDNGAFLYTTDKITGVLVICPKSMKSTWEEEVKTHLPSYISRRVMLWSSGKTDATDVVEFASQPGDLVFLVMNIDALATPKGHLAAEQFLALRRTMMVIDESSRIKTPQAKRSKVVAKLGKSAEYRRILTGTPVTQGPLDVFSQFKFLDENILGFGSFTSFRGHFSIMGGYQNRQILKYVNLDELQALINPYSYRCVKSECLDLPEKVYRKVIVDLSPTQRKLYDQLADDMSAEIEGMGTVNATLALTLLLRLHQVVGGIYPHVAPVVLNEDGTIEKPKRKWDDYKTVPGDNPKLDALMDYIEDVNGKVTIWAHFRPEIDIIAKALVAKYGPESVVEFHGGVDDDGRTKARRRFQDMDDPARFFVAQTETGGIGLTLTASNTVVYYSNSFSLESRLQSEDRNHRIGQRNDVTYTDIVARKTIDDKLLDVLRKKISLANVITGDNWKEWI